MPRLILAPMEGLADDVLRGVLTSAGGYDQCVTEFVRVTDSVLPHGAYLRLAPELRNGARTPSGTPLAVQLLGSSPAILAANAAHLARLAPAGIDLNFGCPTPLVNRHGGGAALLDEPELLQAIVAAVRGAVPPAIPVSAKMRLGIAGTERTLDCARALEAGGAAEITVHARTRTDGYRPPARWEWIADIRQAVAVPLIANGEVWTVADWHAIRAITGVDDVMLGRGAVADPLLAARIRAGGDFDAEAGWTAIHPLLVDFWRGVRAKVLPTQAPGRLKQWLRLLARNYPQAAAMFAAIRATRHADEVGARLGL